ncbi:hypothetical protein HK102_008863, partial [Quaeritorhiza haematococci]
AHIVVSSWFEMQQQRNRRQELGHEQEVGHQLTASVSSHKVEQRSTLTPTVSHREVTSPYETAAPTSRGTGRRIPTEIVDAIIYFIKADDKNTLVSCAAVNRDWAAQALPRIRRRVNVFSSRRLAHFVFSYEQNSDHVADSKQRQWWELGSFVNELRLERMKPEVLATISKHCTSSLEYLEFSGFSRPGFISDVSVSAFKELLAGVGTGLKVLSIPHTYLYSSDQEPDVDGLLKAVAEECASLQYLQIPYVGHLHYDSSPPSVCRDCQAYDAEHTSWVCVQTLMDIMDGCPDLRFMLGILDKDDTVDPLIAEFNYFIEGAPRFVKMRDWETLDPRLRK